MSFRDLIKRIVGTMTAPARLLKPVQLGATSPEVETALDSGELEILVIETKSAVRSLELSEYRRTVGHLPPPTDDQIEAFVQFVSKAHSWYKHLPLLPPGVAFHFFFDLFVACDRRARQSGETVRIERTIGSPLKFHYTWMPTDEYRDRFGYLQYVQKHRPVLCAVDGSPYSLPEEIFRIGASELTGVIHPLAPRGFCWEKFGRLNDPAAQWPHETGGRETFARIQSRCKIIREEPEIESLFVEVGGVDPKLEAILAPERQRLQGAMVDAIKSVRAAIYQ